MSVGFDWTVDTDDRQIDAPILKVEGLAISYETRKGSVPAVRDISFDIQRGEVHGIVGESGCGKSTVALLSAVPIPDPRAEQKHIRLSGTVPSALNPPGGCRFHTRCPRRNLLPDGGKICETIVPPWRDAGYEHRIFCHVPLAGLRQMETVVTIRD